jgi:sterol desaturase/sphingolipid hydroxylase (fatty acid hydroxylase superfamily)
VLEFVAEHGLLIVLVEFAGLFLIFTVWEGRRPYVRPSSVELQESRQTTNLSLFVFNQLFVFVLRWSLVWSFAELEAPGFLDSANIPQPAILVIGVLLLDATSYLRHRIMHTRWLWPAHAAHHSDRALDWTTEFRFHPIEVLVSTTLQILVVVLCGISGHSVILFAIIVLGMGCFQHANVSFSAIIDAYLARVLITPRLHRVHHALEDGKYERNFGVIVPWWDWLFRTYQSPADEREFGVEEIGEQGSLGLNNVLLLPFHFPSRD